MPIRYDMNILTQNTSVVTRMSKKQIQFWCDEQEWSFDVFCFWCKKLVYILLKTMIQFVIIVFYYLRKVY